ncbi:MAG TPA: YebC/PmpR family DNA-binding transcriptional regulator, partial [Gemmatimonadaceae bacterium]
MAGHSKWKQIKHYKAATDAKRGAKFTKLIREITVAAKAGGGDPGGNPRLRLAIDQGRAANMPNENIERAIKKGTGDLGGVEYQEVTYEAYGPGGVAIYIEGLTENLNRTVADVRHALSKNGGNLGTSGSVAWMFEHKGQFIFDSDEVDEGVLLEAALEAGAEDMQTGDGSAIVYTLPGDFLTVQDALRAQGL